MMVSSIKVTIIVTVYNVENYLTDCINSLIDQTYKNIEIIAVNDGSEDASSSILENFSKQDNRIRIINQLNNGVSVARNTALNSNLNGKYTYIMDSDDILEKNAIEKMLAYSEKYDLDILRFDCKNFVDGIEIDKADMRSYLFTIKQINKYFSYYNRDEFLKKSWYYALPTVWCYFFKTSLIQGNNELRFKHSILHEDTLFIPQFIWRANTIGYLKEILYYRRVRPLSIMTESQKNIVHFESVVTVLKELNGFISNLDDISSHVFKKYIETYKAKAFLMLSEYPNDKHEANHSLKKELNVKIPILQRLLFLRRSYTNKKG